MVIKHVHAFNMVIEFSEWKMGNVNSKNLWNFYVTKGNEGTDDRDEEEDNAPAPASGMDDSGDYVGHSPVTVGSGAGTEAPEDFTDLNISVSIFYEDSLDGN